MFQHKSDHRGRCYVAEGVRFELTRPFGLAVFKTAVLNHSTTPPRPYCTACVRNRPALSDEALSVAEDVGLEPTRPLAGSRFSKPVPYHSAQPSGSTTVGILREFDDLCKVRTSPKDSLNHAKR